MSTSNLSTGYNLFFGLRFYPNQLIPIDQSFHPPFSNLDKGIFLAGGWQHRKSSPRNDSEVVEMQKKDEPPIKLLDNPKIPTARRSP
jgi:hypothetical protein